jgi:hypothetical protein
MARRTTHLSDLVARLGRHGLLDRRIDLSNHPHHRARNVLGRLRITREIVHRVARTVEDVAVVAGDAQRGGKILHDLQDLRSRHVFRQHLEVLRRRLWRATSTGALTLRGLRRNRERPREAE